MKADTDTAIGAFAKNEHVRKVFWAVFVVMAGVVLARVADPVTAGQILGVITGGGMINSHFMNRKIRIWTGLRRAVIK